MRHAAINDDSLVDALIDRVGHAADLGDHAARDDAGGLVALDLGDLHLGDEGGFIFLIPQQTRNVGHGDELFGLERDRDLCGGGVSVDVISLAQVVHAHRCNNGDIAAVQQAGDQRRVHVDDLSHMAQLRVKLGAAEHLAVHAAEADAAAPQLCHEVFVHLTGQHLLDDLHGGVVGDAQAARKVALDAHFFEHLIDSRAAAVYQDHPHAQQGQGDEVVHDRVFQRLVDHGVAAVFDDHGLAVVLLDIRGRLREKEGHFFVFHHCSPSQVR